MTTIEGKSKLDSSTSPDGVYGARKEKKEEQMVPSPCKNQLVTERTTFKFVIEGVMEPSYPHLCTIFTDIGNRTRRI